jgi:hypothetical protein
VGEDDDDDEEGVTAVSENFALSKHNFSCSTDQCSHQSVQPEQQARTTEMLRHTLPKISRPRAKSFVLRIVVIYMEAETYAILQQLLYHFYFS